MQEIQNLNAVLEAVLFAAGEPLALNVIAQALEMTPAKTKAALNELKSEYDYQMRGLRLIEMDGTYQLSTRADYFPYVRSVLKETSSSTLSQAALETLAIIAYKQPATRADIEQVRGVQSTSSLDLLIDRGFVRDCGKLDLPGKPMAFETTPEFLKLMNIERLDQLPEFHEFEKGIQMALEEAKGE